MFGLLLLVSLLTILRIALGIGSVEIGKTFLWDEF